MKSLRRIAGLAMVATPALQAVAALAASTDRFPERPIRLMEALAAGVSADD